MPPPVPPEDAPINIKIVIIKWLGNLIKDILTVLNPAVLDAEIEWKNGIIIELFEFISEIDITMNPKKYKTDVSKRLNLVYTAIFFCSFL